MDKKHVAILKVLQMEGSLSTGPLSKHTGIPTSHLYGILENMQDLGLVSVSSENNRKYFEMTSKEAVQRIIKKEKQELDSLCNSVTSIQPNFKNSASLRNFTGIKAIKAMWDIMNGTLSSSSVVKFYSANRDSYKYLIGFYDEHHTLQEQLGVSEKIIFDTNDSEAQRRKNNITEVRVHKLENKAEWGIMNQYVFFQYAVTKEPVAILIDDPIIKQTFEQVFDQVWDASKEL